MKGIEGVVGVIGKFDTRGRWGGAMMVKSGRAKGVGEWRESSGKRSGERVVEGAGLGGKNGSGMVE